LEKRSHWDAERSSGSDVLRDSAIHLAALKPGVLGHTHLRVMGDLILALSSACSLGAQISSNLHQDPASFVCLHVESKASALKRTKTDLIRLIRSLIWTIVLSPPSRGLFVPPRSRQVTESSAHELATAITAAVPTAFQVCDYTPDFESNNLLGRSNGYLAASVIIDAGASANCRCNRSNTTVPSTCCGAVIEEWPDVPAAQRRADYLTRVQEGLPFLAAGRTARVNNLLLRLSDQLESDIADAYETAFRSASTGSTAMPLTVGLRGSVAALVSGWYPNPYSGGPKRYWDGTQWLDDRPTTTVPTAAREPIHAPDSGSDRPRIHLEQFSFGTLFGSGCVTIVAVVLIVPLLSYVVGKDFSKGTTQILMWVIGVPLFLALFIGQLTTSPDEIKCPQCGKRFRTGYTTCRQCGYVQPN
jgi:hypothetical protein